MTRLITMMLVAWLTAGCVSAAKVRVASYQPTQAAKELECMGDCLEASDVDCDECAVRCFAPPTGVVLGLSR
jgi:hypothetical protein